MKYQLRRTINFLTLLSMVYSFQVTAYTSDEGNIERIEAGTVQAVIFFDNCTFVNGVDEPMIYGNGYTNASSGSYLYLARNETELQSTKHLLSMALAAYAAQKRVIVRWEELQGIKVITYLAVK